MKKFRDHVTQLLVATDVAARGLDVDDLSHVINFRTPGGRVGLYPPLRPYGPCQQDRCFHRDNPQSGEKQDPPDREDYSVGNSSIAKVPTPEHIIEKQLYNLADRLERVEVNESEISKYIPGVRKKLEWLSEEDLLKRVLSLEFNRLLTYYQNMPDIDLDEKDKKEKRDRKGERGEKGEGRGKRGDRKGQGPQKRGGRLRAADG